MLLGIALGLWLSAVSLDLTDECQRFVYARGREKTRDALIDFHLMTNLGTFAGDVVFSTAAGVYAPFGDLWPSVRERSVLWKIIEKSPGCSEKEIVPKFGSPRMQVRRNSAIGAGESSGLPVADEEWTYGRLGLCKAKLEMKNGRCIGSEWVEYWSPDDLRSLRSGISHPGCNDFLR